MFEKAAIVMREVILSRLKGEIISVHVIYSTKGLSGKKRNRKPQHSQTKNNGMLLLHR